MPKSYADLLREARAQIREVTPQEVDALPDGAATIVDVREASEWEQGHIPGAQHVSKSYIEQQIEAAAPDRDAPVILYCAGGVRSLFAAQTLAEMGYTDVAVDERAASRAGRAPASSSRRRSSCPPSRSSATAATCSSPRSARPARPGCSRRRRCSSAPAASAVAGRAVPRRGRRRDHRPRRLRRRRPSATSSARSSTRPTGSASARSSRRGSRSTPSTPTSRSSQHEEMLVASNVERIIAGYDVILDGTDTFETRYILNDAAVAAGIPVIHASVFRFEGQLTTFVPFEGPCYRCLYPTPPPPELAPGCSVAGVLGVVPGHPRPAPDQRGAQGPARDRQRRWPAGCCCSMPSRPSSPSSSSGATRTARSAPTRPSRRARPAGRWRRPTSARTPRSC